MAVLWRWYEKLSALLSQLRTGELEEYIKRYHLFTWADESAFTLVGMLKLAFLLLAALGLGGCSLNALSVTSVTPDLSQGLVQRGLESATETINEFTVSWLVTGELAISSKGSSSCPLVVVGIIEAAPAQIVLEAATTVENCSADMALTTSTFPAPSGWEKVTPLEVEYLGSRAIISLHQRR